MYPTRTTSTTGTFQIPPHPTPRAMAPLVEAGSEATSGGAGRTGATSAGADPAGAAQAVAAPAGAGPDGAAPGVAAQAAAGLIGAGPGGAAQAGATQGGAALAGAAGAIPAGAGPGAAVPAAVGPRWAVPAAGGSSAGAAADAAARAGAVPDAFTPATAAPRWAVPAERDRVVPAPATAGHAAAEAGIERGSHWPGGHDRAASGHSATAPAAAGRAEAEPEAGTEPCSHPATPDRAGSAPVASGRAAAEAATERGSNPSAEHGRAASAQAASAQGASAPGVGGWVGASVAVASGAVPAVGSAASASGTAAPVTEWTAPTGWDLAAGLSGPLHAEAGAGDGREAGGFPTVGVAPHGLAGRIGEAARSDVPAARAQAGPGVDIPHPQDEAAHAAAATLRPRHPDTETARPHPQDDEARPPAVSLSAATARAEHAPRHAGPPAAWDLPGQGGSSAEQGRAPQHAVPAPAAEAAYADPHPVRDLPEPGDAGPADRAAGRELTWSVPAPGAAGDADPVGGDPTGGSPVGNGPAGNGPVGGDADSGRETSDGQAVTLGSATGGSAADAAEEGEPAHGEPAHGEPAHGEAATGPQPATGNAIVPGPEAAAAAAGPDVADVVARAVARIAEDDTQDLPRVAPPRGVAVTEVPVHLPFRGAGQPTPQPQPNPQPKPGDPAPPKAKAAATRPAPGRRVPRGDDRLHEHRGPVLPGWIAVAVGGIALAGCAVVLWRAGAVPDALAVAFGAEPRPYRGLQARFWPPLAFLGVVALLALGGLGRGRAGHAWVLTLFGRYRGTVRRSGLTWISPLLLRRRVDVRLRHWRSDPMPAVDSGGLALQVVVQVVWQVKDTARATLAVEDHVDYLAEQVESAMARVLSQLPADAFHEDAPTLRDAEAVGDALTRMLAAETEAVGVEVFSAQPTRIEYAPEVADAMRRRRVAAIDAKHRDTVLTSVVDAVDDTVHRLTSRGIVELDDYERKALVKDLTVAFYTGRSE
ncbi:SPFH domain-containing protein [Streptomyces sp. NBC_01298]|uniref:SPFH domain-containing protein n=1 Tax=Streptomyces sp. NBC_01298 TaxID=2903817 RepID=UPI002E11BEFC|nr:SPFH domain-containing protein [Streptomyces sp. NBC_01298]